MSTAAPQATSITASVGVSVPKARWYALSSYYSPSTLSPSTSDMESSSSTSGVWAATFLHSFFSLAVYRTHSSTVGPTAVGSALPTRPATMKIQ